MRPSHIIAAYSAVLSWLLLVVVSMGCEGCKSQGTSERGLATAALRRDSANDNVGVSDPPPKSSALQPAAPSFGGVGPERVDANDASVARTPDEITFVTEGSSFAPVVVVDGDAQIHWTWDDGTESNLARPQKSFGSRARRLNRLHVEPWSNVRRINIGYDAQDGGDPSFERVTDQEVSAVLGLEVVSPYLEQWFSSYNRIESLELSHFRQLRVVECYQSRSLKRIGLADTPKLRRLCVEADSLASLDISGSPALEDLRGAMNAFPDIQLGTSGAMLWHICIRDNPQLVDSHFFAQGTRFPQLAELFAWKTNQKGTLAIHSTHPTRPIEIWAKENAFNALNLVGALKAKGADALVDVSSNALEHVLIQGCVQIKRLRLSHNRLSAAAVDAVLAQANAWKTHGGTIDLRFNSPPTSTGKHHQQELEARQWKIDVDSAP